MCLALPGELIDIDRGEALHVGRVSFAGTLKRVCLAYTPEAVPGDYLLVHAGFSISIVSQRWADAIEIDLNTALKSDLP